MSLAKEIRKLANEPLDGIKVQLNEEDVTDVVAEITGPGARRTVAFFAFSAPRFASTDASRCATCGGLAAA